MPDKEALLWEKEKEHIRCNLCNHHCLIPEGKRGNCGVRENQEGKLIALTYGKPCSIAVDPIEKKPFNNFWPGSRALSIATVGCNFSCKFCQNWQISQAKPEAYPTRYVNPEEVVQKALEMECQGIAYTYTEPTIFFEYANDIAKLAVEKGLYNVFVTNGYMTQDMLRKAEWLDAANVDLKAFSEDFYMKICGGIKFQPILDNIKWMHEHGIHVELTTLLIPGMNDSREELTELVEWVAELDESIPLHFSRFRPAHKMKDKPVTPEETLELAHQLAKEAGLDYVYVGNVMGNNWESTFCPECGHKVIHRIGFTLENIHLDDGKCPECGEEIRIIGEIRD